MTRNVEIYDNICGNPDLKSTNLTERLIWVLAFDQSVVVCTVETSQCNDIWRPGSGGATQTAQPLRQ